MNLLHTRFYWTKFSKIWQNLITKVVYNLWEDKITREVINYVLSLKRINGVKMWRKKGIMPGERNNIKLCHDVIFKGIFLREKELLLKMIYDITNITETMQYEEILTGYELEPYKVNGKVNKSDMLIKINDRYFINVELNYKHQKNVLVRNMIQLFRICGQVLESWMTDNELSLIKVGQLNFNTFSNSNDKVLERVFYTNGKKWQHHYIKN